MNAPGFVEQIENSGVGEWLRSSVLAMPWVNAIHVLCVTLVFGTILVVDLRLLGLFDRARAVTRVSDEMLRITWAAFIGAVVTGALFFAANATTYWFNLAFRFKMLAILAAGVNMLVFRRRGLEPGCTDAARGAGRRRAVDPAVGDGAGARPGDRLHQGLRSPRSRGHRLRLQLRRAAPQW